jgi:DNA polymerase IV
MERRILHIDMDAFFASVEQVRDPSLVGKPLIIGGDLTDTRGVVSTASYEARKYGVHSAMPLSEAKRRCPHGVFMRGNFEHYRDASLKVRAVLDTVSPLVEMASIDEAYVDVTGSQRLFGGDDAIAAHIKGRIREDTGLPCTVSVSPNKLVSKIATDEAKPDGYLRIPAGGEAAFLRPLPIGKMPGIGPRTREILESIGLMTLGALADVPIDALTAVFGASAHGLQRSARGESTSGVVTASEPKSISRETTFGNDQADWAQVGRVLTYLAERCAHTLRGHGMEARCVTLKVRYADFKTVTFARTLPEPTSLDGEILDVLRQQVPRARERRIRVRLIGVALSGLSHDQHQLRLFGGAGREKWGQVLESVDALRDRHGFDTLRTARSMSLGKKVTLATPSLSR